MDTENLPPCWSDNVRMDALFAPFRVRSVNAENYDAKMKFWKEMIQKYCLHQKGSAEITLKELRHAFKRNEKLPYCLDAVLDDMRRGGDIIPTSEFNQLPQNTWSGWAVNSLVKKPLLWGFQKLKSQIQTNQPEPESFVVWNAVKEQSKNLQKCFESQSENILSIADVREKLPSVGLSVEGCQLALHYLHTQQMVTMDESASLSENESRVLYKFAPPNKKCEPITSLEKSVYDLSVTEMNLMRMVEKLESDASQVDQQARNYLKEGKRQLAKSCLKKKRLIEQNIERRAGALDNIQILLARVHDSKHDGQVVEAYKMGSKALKEVFAESNISVDAVDDTLLEIREQLESHDEIQATLGESMAPAADDAELEAELEDLLMENTTAGNNDGGMVSPEQKLPVHNEVPSNPDLEILERLNRLRVNLPDLPDQRPVENPVLIRN